MCSIRMQMFYLRIQTRAEFSNKKQQNSVLSGAKHIQDICAASGIHCLPHGSSGCRLDGTSSCSLGKTLQSAVCSPEVEAGAQVFHPQAAWTVLPQPLALGTGVFKYGITTAVQMLLIHLPWNRRKLANLSCGYNGSLFIIFHIE